MVKITAEQCRRLADELNIPAEWNDKGEFCSIDLSSSWLNRSNLRDVFLRLGDADNIDMRFTNLSEGDFQHVNASEADFSKANLSEAKFEGANLSEASFRNAGLQRADFMGANLEGAMMPKEQASKIIWLGPEY